jgi:hypothetical protein
MSICDSRITKGLMVSLGLIVALPAMGLGQSASYLDHDGLTRELRTLVNSSSLATMESLGTTRQGREVWMAQVGDSEGAPFDERPGILVVGNLEGDHLVGSHLALEAIRYLLENTGDEAVRKALTDHVFYVFPRLNPDGAEAMFAGVKWNRTANTLPLDADNDGRTDEDGPEDLNGDGFITVMRVADPAGPYMIDASDARLMKRADATRGESGAYTLYWEGTDNDGDGFINEDGPGGVDLNRNFQHEYPYWEGDAGPHMVSEVESRALMDFVIAHRNIAAILTFGESDNLVTPPDARGTLAGAKVPSLTGFADASTDGVFQVGVFGAGGGGGGGGRGGGRGGGGGGGIYLRGAQPGRDNDPSSGTRPATTVVTQDLVYFEAISAAYKRITGIENVPVHRTPEGAFFQYGYYQYGVPSFSTLGWGVAAGELPGRGGGQRGDSSADAGILSGLEAAGIEAFVDWSPFQHPDLGEVEIGGFIPYVTHNPPFEQVPEMGAKHGEFLVELAGMLPRVRIAETKVTAHGGGLFTITVEVENTGFLPTALRHGQRNRAVGPTLLQLHVDNDNILSGASKTASVSVLAGSGSRASVTWFIRGREGAEFEVTLRSMKAGHDTTTVTLR